MENEKQFDEYLQHIRLIHLSLLVVSATITYLVVSTWSAANELVIDLNEFTQMIENAAQSNQEPQRLAAVLPDWRKIGIEPIQRSIEEQVGRAVSFSDPDRGLRILSVEPGPLPSEFKSLEDSRSELERRRWLIEVPDRIQSDLSDVGNWVPAISARADPNYPLNIRITPTIRMNIKSWPSDTQPGYADLEAVVTFTETEFERNANGNVQPKQQVRTFNQTFVNKEWKSRKTLVSVTPDSLAKRFYWMTNYWDSIKSYPYQRALDWANNQRTEELKSRNPNLFGIEIKGEHIGYVGPLLTGCLLMYLLSFLIQLYRLTEQDGAGVRAAGGMLSPWIGTMWNPPAVVITWISLIVGPIAAIGLPLWRLLGVRLLWATALALLAGLAGFLCAWISSRLARKYFADVAGATKT